MARLVTPVRTQPDGDERCIAYAVAAAMEAFVCRELGTVEGAPEISVDDLFRAGGQEIGAIDGIAKAIENGGVVDAGCFPPTAHGRCANPVPHLWRGRIRAVGGPRKTRVGLMRQQLREAGPLVALLQVFSNFVAFRGTGIYEAVPPKAGFHALCIVGDGVAADGSSGHWIAKNSMGPAWGDDGFVKIAWNDVDIRLEDVVFVVEDVHQ